MPIEDGAVTVVAAQRDPLRLHGFAAALDRQPSLRLLQAVRSGREAVEAIEGRRPGVALLDAGMADLQAPMILYALRRRGAETKVVFTLEDPGSDFGLRLVGAGASGCLLESAGWDRICAALLAVSRGEIAASPDLGVVCGRRLPEAREEDRARLSEVELRLLRAVAEGLTVSQIARCCECSPARVGPMVASLCQRLDVEERLGAVAEALRQGILP